MRRLVFVACVASLAFAGVAGAKPGARSWAQPQIQAVVDAGLLAPSTDAFRPDDALTASELATVLAAFGVPEMLDSDPHRPVAIRELDAKLVTAAGLRDEARAIRVAAAAAGLAPKPWVGTEAVARLVGFRINHERAVDERELQVNQPATRAEAAYSVARLLSLRAADLAAVRAAVETFWLPDLTLWQQTVLRRALRFVGSPYVFAGTSERPQQLFGRTLPGGFDCSGFVWRVFKTEPFAGAPGLADTLKGRTSYAMSAEVPRAARIPRSAIEPGDVVFFGDRGPRSKPAEVGHMGIYLGGGWIVHSSRTGTTLQPLTGWYETTFAWARRPLAEAGIGW